MPIDRRSFLIGLGATAVAGPAVARVATMQLTEHWDGTTTTFDYGAIRTEIDWEGIQWTEEEIDLIRGTLIRSGRIAVAPIVRAFDREPSR